MTAHQQAMEAARIANGMDKVLERSRPARIVVEHFDHLDDMCRCSDCRRAGVYNDRRRTGCPAFIPEQAALERRCHRYQPKGSA